MKASFIVPLYNGLTLTRAMLSSLRETLPQDLNYEVILVDDGSTDGTRRWLETLSGPRFRIILNERRLGYAANNNRGARIASGEYFVLLNNDLAMLPGWFEPMLALAEQPNAGIVGNVQLSVRTRHVHHAGVFFDPTGAPFHFQPSLDFLRTQHVLSTPAVTGAVLMVRGSLYRDLGGFDEGYFNSYEDIDLCLRARSAGVAISVAAQSAAYHYICSAPGRHDAEDRNRMRFEARWRETVCKLSAIETPPAQTNLTLHGGAHPVPFDREAYATLQAFHPVSGGHAEDCSSVHVYRTGRWARVHVPLDRGLIDGGVALRLDPCDFSARIRVASVALSCGKSKSRVWRRSGAEGLATVFEVAGTAAAVAESDRWLSVDCTGRDPQLVFRSSALPNEFKERSNLTADIWIHTALRD